MLVNVCLDDIFWTADHFATKLGLIVHYHKQGCLIKTLDYCVQDQGHSECSKCQWMFVQMIFSESQNILLPNLVWWCSTMSQSHAEIFCCCCYNFQGQGHSEGSYGQNMSFYDIIWNDSLATKLGMMICHHKPECPVKKKKDYCIPGQGNSEGSKC